MKLSMTLILEAGSVSAANQTGAFTGVITDTMRNKVHTMMKISQTRNASPGALRSTSASTGCSKERIYASQ